METFLYPVKYSTNLDLKISRSLSVSQSETNSNFLYFRR